MFILYHVNNIYLETYYFNHIKIGEIMFCTHKKSKYKRLFNCLNNDKTSQFI